MKNLKKVKDMTTSAELTPAVLEAVNAFRNIAFYEAFSSRIDPTYVYRTECRLYEIFDLLTPQEKSLYADLAQWLENTGLALADPTTEELFTVFNSNNQ